MCRNAWAISAMKKSRALGFMRCWRADAERSSRTAKDSREALGWSIHPKTSVCAKSVAVSCRCRWIRPQVRPRRVAVGVERGGGGGAPAGAGMGAGGGPGGGGVWPAGGGRGGAGGVLGGGGVLNPPHPNKGAPPYFPPRGGCPRPLARRTFLF